MLKDVAAGLGFHEPSTMAAYHHSRRRVCRYCYLVHNATLMVFLLTASWSSLVFSLNSVESEYMELIALLIEIIAKGLKCQRMTFRSVGNTLRTHQLINAVPSNTSM